MIFSGPGNPFTLFIDLPSMTYSDDGNDKFAVVDAVLYYILSDVG